MKNYKQFISSILMVLSLDVSAEALSYSGRLTNGNGSPLTGAVDLKFELAYSNATGAILCTSDVSGVQLTHGVFHVKLDFVCPSSSLYEVLGNVPVGQEAVVRVTNETANPDKVYSFQSLHAVPVAQLAHQLPKMSATNDQVLTWTGSKWEPKSVTGATGGTVTSVATGSGLTGGPFTTTGTIAIATGGVTDSHLASGIARAKLAGGTPNYVIVNDGAGALSQVAQLPLAQGGTGANTAAAARTNLGLGSAAEANIGFSAGQVMPGSGVPVCLAFEKLQFTGIGPTYWACAADNDSADGSKLPLAGGTMSGAINMNNNFIVGVRTPSDPADATNKAYVDAQVSGSSHWTKTGSDLSYSAGNVGIGIAAPPHKLYVLDGRIVATGADGFYQVGNDSNDSNLGKISFHTTSTKTTNRYWTGIAYNNGNGSMSIGGGDSLNLNLDSGSSGSYGSHIFRKVGWDGTNRTFTESVRIDPNGNVGIGTAGPNAKLHVASGGNSLTSYTARFQSSPGVAGAGGILFDQNSTYSFKTHTEGTTSTTTGALKFSYIDTATGNDIHSDVLTLRNGNVELTGGLRLKSNTANYVTLTAPASLAANFGYTLPVTAPTAGQILSSSAAGVMSWISPASAPVSTVFGRTGAVVAAAGDYTATQITNTPAGNIASITVQAALNELDTEKQSSDTTLSSLAAFNTDGILVQTAADTFAGRSIVGTTNRTTITNGNGVAGNPSIDVSTTLLPSPVAGDIGKYLKATAANTSVWSALASGDITTALGFTPINKAGDTIASGTLEFNGTSVLKLANLPANPTDAANKQYVDAQIAGASNQWTVASGNVYRSSGNVGVGTATPSEKLHIVGNTAIDGSLRLKSDNANYVTMTAPASLATNFSYTLPLTAPTAGQILSSSAAGVMSWISPPTAPVSTVFGRSGAVVATAGDYTATQITNTPAGNIASTTVQAALNELDTEKQSSDTTLSSLAAFNTNGILVQTAADTFAGRSIVGITNRTTITNGNGVAGNPTIDVSTTLLPSPVAGDIGKYLKATAANTSVWTALTSGDITTALGFTPINKAGDTIASGTLEFNGIGILKLTNSPVNLTDATNKQYVDDQIAGASNQWSSSGGNVYRTTGRVGIGNSAPTVTFQVGTTTAGTGDVRLGRIIFNSNTGTIIDESFGLKISLSDNADAQAFRVFNTSAELMRVQSGGNVGIGTASPIEKLDVRGTTTMSASTEGVSSYVSSGAAYSIPDSSLNIRRITLTANTTITLPAFTSTPTRVYTLTVFLKQDATGSRTAVFAGNGADTVKWDSGAAPSITLTASKITIVQFTRPSDETVWYASKVWQED